MLASVYWALDETISVWYVSNFPFNIAKHKTKHKGNRRTLNICHALRQNLLQHLGVLQFLLHLGDDVLGQLLLLALLNLALIADP